MSDFFSATRPSCRGRVTVVFGHFPRLGISRITHDVKVGGDLLSGCVCNVGGPDSVEGVRVGRTLRLLKGRLLTI